jgi:predicted dehydrogenase
MSTDVASARELINVAKRTGKPLVIGHHRRFNPYVNAAKAALAANAIGRPIALSGLWTLKKPASYYAPPTDWRTKAGSGGPILINFIHDIDILQYLLGPIVRVHAEKISSQRGHAVEGGAAVLLRFASGVVGTFIVSDNVASTHSFESGTGENPIIPRAGKDFYRIFGENGTLSVGDMKLTKYGEGVDKSWANALQVEDVAVRSETPFDEQVANFVAVIRGHEQPRCSGEDGLKAMAVCDAVARAMETGNPIDVNE